MKPSIENHFLLSWRSVFLHHDLQLAAFYVQNSLNSQQQIVFLHCRYSWGRISLRVLDYWKPFIELFSRVLLQSTCSDLTKSDCNFAPTLSVVEGCLAHSSLYTEFERRPSAPICLLIKSDSDESLRGSASPPWENWELGAELGWSEISPEHYHQANWSVCVRTPDYTALFYPR